MPVAAAMIVTAHASDAMVAIPFWLEMFAVVAASISGVLVAREHKLDLVGAVALAVVCGLGGGLLRDMTLQVCAGSRCALTSKAPPKKISRASCTVKSRQHGTTLRNATERFF